MKRVLGIEFKRAFINKMFFIGLLVGGTICVVQIFTQVLPMLEYQERLTTSDYHPHSVFSKWIGAAPSFEPTLYFALLPLLAALPFADSLFSDRHSGYVKNIFSRTNRKKYYAAKFIAVFLSGGCVVVLPLLLNLYLSALILPGVTPDVSMGTYPVFSTAMWSELFYTVPYLYVFIYLALIFVVSGFLATIALSVSFFVKYKYVVLLTPFIVYQLISFFAKFVVDYGLDMQLWLNPAQYFPFEFNKAGFELFVLIVAVLGVYLVKVKQDETY